MFVSPPNSYVEILCPKVMVSGDGALEGCSGRKGGALTDGVSGLTRGDTETRDLSLLSAV